MLVEHIIILALSGFGVFHGLSLGFYLVYTEVRKKSANFTLGILLVLMGIRISKSIFLYFMADLDYVFITLGLSLVLSFGPLFYFYVRQYIDENFSFSRYDILHAIPFLLFFGLNSFNLLSREFYLAFGIYFIYLHFLAYIIFAFFYQKRWYASSTESPEPVRKSWLLLIHVGIIVIWISYFMFLLDELVPYIMGPVTYSLVIYPLSIWAFIKKPLNRPEQKYQSSSLDENNTRQLTSKLTSCMENEHPYLNADLKLPELADMLKVTPHMLSQVVNQEFGINFQQYLNSYRVRHAMEKLSAEKFSHLTISSIALDSGFNSLSAFNAAFKKEAGLTPSQYRKSALS